ncbi:hypothetical protein FRB95_014506 [Tulasnella sp. JGI-2019a]|nr:hypothetical protein FRB95_014506 [Tulasnella sp. JGI-2019a]
MKLMAPCPVTIERWASTRAHGLSYRPPYSGGGRGSEGWLPYSTLGLGALRLVKEFALGRLPVGDVTSMDGP